MFLIKLCINLLFLPFFGGIISFVDTQVNGYTGVADAQILRKAMKGLGTDERVRVFSSSFCSNLLLLFQKAIGDFISLSLTHTHPAVRYTICSYNAGADFCAG